MLSGAGLFLTDQASAFISERVLNVVASGTNDLAIRLKLKEAPNLKVFKQALQRAAAATGATTHNEQTTLLLGDGTLFSQSFLGGDAPRDLLADVLIVGQRSNPQKLAELWATHLGWSDTTLLLPTCEQFFFHLEQELRNEDLFRPLFLQRDLVAVKEDVEQILAQGHTTSTVLDTISSNLATLLETMTALQQTTLVGHLALKPLFDHNLQTIVTLLDEKSDARTTQLTETVRAELETIRRGFEQFVNTPVQVRVPTRPSSFASLPPDTMVGAQRRTAFSAITEVIGARPRPFAFALVSGMPGMEADLLVEEVRRRVKEVPDFLVPSEIITVSTDIGTVEAWNAFIRSHIFERLKAMDATLPLGVADHAAETLLRLLKDYPLVLPLAILPGAGVEWQSSRDDQHPFLRFLKELSTEDNGTVVVVSETLPASQPLLRNSFHLDLELLPVPDAVLLFTGIVEPLSKAEATDIALVCRRLEGYPLALRTVAEIARTRKSVGDRQAFYAHIYGSPPAPSTLSGKRLYQQVQSAMAPVLSTLLRSLEAEEGGIVTRDDLDACLMRLCLFPRYFDGRDVRALCAEAPSLDEGIVEPLVDHDLLEVQGSEWFIPRALQWFYQQTLRQRQPEFRRWATAVGMQLCSRATRTLEEWCEGLALLFDAEAYEQVDTQAVKRFGREGLGQGTVVATGSLDMLPEDVQTARAALWLATLFDLQGRAERAVYYAQGVLRAVADSPDTSALVVALTLRAYTLLIRNDAEEAQGYLQEGQALLEGVGTTRSYQTRWEEAQFLFLVAREARDVATAKAGLERAHTLFTEVGDPIQVLIAQANLLQLSDDFYTEQEGRRLLIAQIDALLDTPDLNALWRTKLRALRGDQLATMVFVLKEIGLDQRGTPDTPPETIARNDALLIETYRTARAYTLQTFNTRAHCSLLIDYALWLRDQQQQPAEADDVMQQAQAIARREQLDELQPAIDDYWQRAPTGQ